MSRQDLYNISYPSDREKKLKSVLRKKYEEYGENNAIKTLIERNSLILSSCNLDENNFNYILIKEYIYSLYNKNAFRAKTISDKDKAIIKEFNSLIINNDFKNALNVYQNNYTIYQLLCLSYLKNLFFTEPDKVKNLEENAVNDIYNKIDLLKNTDLTFKREENVKVYRKVSSK